MPLFRVFYKFCKQGNWFSFYNRVRKNCKPCFKDAPTSLKKWKDKFFLVDRRAAPIAMPWRYHDSSIVYLFPRFGEFSESDAESCYHGGAKAAAADVPRNVEKDARKKHVDKEGTSRKKERKTRQETPPTDLKSEHVSSPTHLNHSKPLEALANEADISENFFAAWLDALRNHTDDLLTSYGGDIHGSLEKAACKKGIIEQLKLFSGYFLEGSIIFSSLFSGVCPFQAVDGQFHRLTATNLIYAHESCKEMKARYKECKKEMYNIRSTYDENVSAYDQLLKDYNGVMNIEKGLNKRVEELKGEKKGLENVNAEQMDQIKQLKDKLKKTEEGTHQLRLDRKKLVVLCGNGEIVRQMIIKEYLHTFVRWLHQSAEYKQNLGEVFSLTVGKGFIDGISIGRKEEDVQAIFAETPNVDPAALATFISKYEALFDKRYPFVDKVASAYHRDPFGL
ncbi:hypothetical protein Tco_0920433 [Tanacetum coccineum]